MGKQTTEDISRRQFLGGTISAAVVVGVGCGDDGGASQSGTGGAAGTAGGSATGGTSASAGGPASGGVPGTGAATGGSATGGSATGGSATGGTGAGGSATGGASTGGAETGGAPGTGGSSSGGTAGTSGASGSGGSAGTGGTSSGTPPLVSLVRSSDVIQATMDAIDAAGGLPDLSGQVVMLRPNAIDTGPPGSVNPDVIRGVIRAVLARGTPSSILVADDTFTGGTLGRMEGNGIAAAATEEGATPMGLEDGATTTVTEQQASNWPDGLPFYDEVLNAQYLINIPVCKTHAAANFSMALKGWYGNVPRSARNQSHANLATIGSTMPEMHLVKAEQFVVLDATQCLLTGGPQVGNGIVAAPGIVVASPDPVAVDVTGLCIIKHYLEQTGTSNNRIANSSVWDQPQIARAMELTSLGWLTSAQDFAFAAAGVDEADTIMAYRNQ